MEENEDIHPNAPAGGGGFGKFRSASPAGTNPAMDKWTRPGPLGLDHQNSIDRLTISGAIIGGGPLSQRTIRAVNAAAAKTPAQWRRYVAYADSVKIGGSLAWRANNPGNFRGAASKIGTVHGAVGTFAVFASVDAGRAAQRSLYLSTYGDMKVSAAINKLTPPSENDTVGYLALLKAAGVALEKSVASQIDPLMKAVEANEGLIEGTVVARVP
jgi:hypothetical protein